MTEPWRTIDRFLAGRGVRIGPPTVGQTTGGAHAPNSLHYVGRARDYGRSNSDLARILDELLPWATGPDHVLAELFGLEVYVKGGRVIEPSKGLYAGHQGHVHAGLRLHQTMPAPPATTTQEVPVADAPDLPNIEGPLTFHPIANSAGEVTGYYIFSAKTGELHTHPHPDHPGKVRYLGRSEDPTPG